MYCITSIIQPGKHLSSLKEKKFSCILNSRKSFQVNHFFKYLKKKVKENSLKMASTISFSANICNSWVMNKIPEAKDS